MISILPSPEGGACIMLATRADVAELFAALVAAQVKGVGADLTQQLLDLLSKAPKA